MNKILKNKNILITGGAGFIGGHLIERLIDYNHILVIDNFNEYYSGKEEQFDLITRNYKEKEDFELIKADLVNKSIFDRIELDIDIIFHLAAQAGVRYSIQNAAEVAKNNIVSTVNIFEFGLNSEVEKILFASSSSVYGNPIYTPLDEDHPKNPISPYAISKLSGEIYADYYYRERNLPVTSTRFYTVYGPRGRPDMAIRKFFKLILQGKKITIYGDGSQLRDFTYISDIVDGLILAAGSQKSNGEIFNLGCSNPISVNKLVELMYNIADKPKNIVYIEKQEGDVEVTYSDTTKALEMLDYNPKINIEKGLKKTFDWQEAYFFNNSNPH
ncbi:MAG: NAD-dependent epimerase/dehydratase family protein [Candidatus Lokiarchaeota archaeon]|nr:NAD-dependent epimerase/dehydratase family protein [Candidatus Lokiarchaeota archaeon]